MARLDRNNQNTINSMREAEGSGQILPKSKLLKGAAILSMAAIISKLIGTMQKIPLQNIAGDEVFGLYNAAYPFYLFLIFLATAGIPTTIALLVSERAAIGDHYGARRVMTVSISVMLGSGFLFFIMMYWGADWIARLIGVQGTAASMRSVAWAMLFVPVMSALRGCFQGYQNMTLPAVSQVVEQLVRVATMIIILLWFVNLNAPAERIAAGAMFGSVAGAVAGLLIMLYAWWKWIKRITHDGLNYTNYKTNSGTTESTRHLVKRIIQIALPICLGTITVPILNIVDTFTMPRLLHTVHASTQEAMRQFGLFNHGLPLVQLVSMIAASIGAAIVPALSEASGNAALARSRSQAAMHAAWLIGLPSAVGLALTAKPVNMMLYASAEGSFTMAVLGITALFSTLAVISTSVLNGLGDVRGPAVAMFVAVAVKIIGNVLLVPRYGITGGAVAAILAYAVAAGLNLVRLHGRTAVVPRGELWRRVGLPIMACGMMGVVVLALLYGGEQAFAAAGHPLPLRLEATVLTLVAVAAGIASYAAALVWLRALSPELAGYIPGASKLLRFKR